MADHALPDLVSRIKVDSSGVDTAMMGLVQSFGKANLALAGLAAGIGILVVGGKSMIDIAEKHDKATLGLKQAVAAYNSEVGKTPPVAGESVKAAAAMTLAHERITLAQHAYTDAVKRHGVTSDQALRASIALQAAQDKLKQTHEATTVAVNRAAINLTAYQHQIDDFIMANRRYISDQSEVIDGYAKLTRSGLTQTEVQKDMSRAVDLAALKQISLSEAVDLLNKAEQGRLRGLIDLGISTGKYTDAQGNLINGTKDVSRVMTELDGKLKGGRDTLTSLQQHSNQLNNDWQDLSHKGGPVLLTLLDAVVKGATAIYDWFDRIGKDNKLWATINDRLVKMAQWLHTYIIAPIQAFMNSKWAPGQVSSPGGYGDIVGKQHGGRVIPGQVYTVGETGPELFAPSVPGQIIPNSNTYNLTLNGSSAVNDPEGVRRMLQRMQLLGAAG